MWKQNENYVKNQSLNFDFITLDFITFECNKHYSQQVNQPSLLRPWKALLCWGWKIMLSPHTEKIEILQPPLLSLDNTAKINPHQ